MTFSANPEAEALNAELSGNPELLPLREVVPEIRTVGYAWSVS